MINNYVLRSVRFMLKLDDPALAAIIALGGGDVPAAQLGPLLKREDESGFTLCDNRVMAQFLDGLIIHRRGRDESAPPRAPERSVTNNTVLKKLRVAFQLKEDDLLQMLGAAGFKVSRPELSALFRAEAHHNFRPCGDQFLRNFLKSLTARVRG